jgi:hypothetical protein
MFAKHVLLTLLAACGVHPNATADRPPDAEQPDGHNEETVQEDQHFCCHSVDPKTFTGEGCVLIDKTTAVLCDKLLYCPGKYVKDDGKVYCE